KLLAEDVTDEGTWAELERLARVASAEDRLAEIYATELDKIASDEPATARLAYRTGELFEARGVPSEDSETSVGQLNTEQAEANISRALMFYRRAYQFAPEDEQRSFEAIDRLLTVLRRSADRVALYRDALEYRTAASERVATLHVIARLEEEELSDDDSAILTLRNILDVDEADVPALDTLARLYTRRERWRDLADLHRRRAEQSALPEEEAKWRLAFAGVLDKKLDEAVGALDELETVLGLATTQ